MPASSGGAGFELVSGPDLGGGFLHQLTVERFSGVHRFVYHAQDGGPDANGPPIGTPEPFGYALHPGMCPLGGRACWHREFTLRLEDALRVRTAYNRTRFVFEAMLAQAYRGVAVPMAGALEELAPKLDSLVPPAPWYLAGPAALLVRGAPIAPSSIEIGTTPDAVGRIAGEIPEYVTEPAAPTAWSDRTVLAGRAFVGTLQSGVRVGWGVPLDEADRARPTELSILGHGVAPDRVAWRALTVPVAPLEATVVALGEAGEDALLAAAEPWLFAQVWDRDRFEAFLRSTTLDENRRRSLRRFAGNRPTDSL